LASRLGPAALAKRAEPRRTTMPVTDSAVTVARTAKQPAPRGRKRSNYGVSIYQEAPQMVQRKRKATEISIFSTGSYPLLEAQQKAEQLPMPPLPPPPAASTSMSSLPPAPALRPTTSGMIEALLDFDDPLQAVPMRRTRSRGLPSLDGLPLAHGLSAFEEAFDALDAPQRHVQDWAGGGEALPPAPAFRPTMSGLQEALGASPKRTRPRPAQPAEAMPPAPSFRPTVSGIAEALDVEAPVLESSRASAPSLPPAYPVRRTRSRGPAELLGLPMLPSVSGMLFSLLDEGPSDDWNQILA